MLQHPLFTLWFTLETTTTFYLRHLELFNGKEQFSRHSDLFCYVGVIHHQGMGHPPTEQFQTELRSSQTDSYSATSHKMPSCSYLPTEPFRAAGNPRSWILPLLPRRSHSSSLTEEQQHSLAYLPCKLWQNKSCPMNVRVVVFQTPLLYLLLRELLHRLPEICVLQQRQVAFG